MPENLKRVRIFVSCPEDMRSQVAVIESLAQELSPFLEDSLGVTLKVLNWRTDIAPGIDIDPQARINTYLSKCDIYIGLLGVKFGTATTRAGSGTEDEFQHAYKKYKEQTSSIRLLFYFKNDASNIHAIDLDELGKVQRFRGQLSSLGVLFGDYTTASEFADLLRNHLRLIFSDDWEKDGSWRLGNFPAEPQQTARARDLTPVTERQKASEPDVSGDFEAGADEELGVLDFAVQLEDGSSEFAEAMSRLTSASQSFGQALETKTQLATAMGKNPSASAKQRQELTDSIARDLRSFSISLATDGGNAQGALVTMLSALEGTLTTEFADPKADRSQLPILDSKLVELSSSLEQARDGMIRLAATFADLPPLTRHVKSAKRAVAEQIEKFVFDMSQSLERLTALRGQIRAILANQTETAE